MAVKDREHSSTTVESMSRAKAEGGNTNLWLFARHERAEVVWLWNIESRANQEAVQKALEMGGRREGGCHGHSYWIRMGSLSVWVVTRTLDAVITTAHRLAVFCYFEYPGRTSELIVPTILCNIYVDAEPAPSHC